MNNLDDAQKRIIAKQMLKMFLARMTPEQKKLFLLNMQRMGYKIEVQKRLQKHKRIIGVLVLPLLPITTLISILKAFLVKRMYLKQAQAVALNLKRMRELAESEPRNFISPERKKAQPEVKKQKDYVA